MPGHAGAARTLDGSSGPVHDHLDAGPTDAAALTSHHDRADHT
ncbi:hypothetical protein JD79_00162 [Geodermatophilus normandii]|uniref:Uncharacterized protein n=1 Tax=Geodermatophilus normandii TaxID=1137989 RepID=A0A317QEL2_9ACTN|nr:hypothetical protein JD79_00162 [Geodermatophilus normandii]